MLDKFLCATATTFISSHGSIFSEHIGRMRRSWRTEECHDHEICTLFGSTEEYNFHIDVHKDDPEKALVARKLLGS